MAVSEEDALEQLQEDWRTSAEAFASCFHIADKNARTVEFVVSPPQRQALHLLENHKKGIILKGRQMWITTIMLIWQIRLCWMRPGVTCVVVLHTDANAVLMSDRCENLYHGNEILTDLMGITQKNAHRILFDNGSQILFTTANSPFLRSFPVNFAHFSEARDYDDLGATLASLKVASDGQIFIESTAGGEDDFHGIWTDKDTDFAKQFLCWRDHPEYTRPDPLPTPLLKIEREYITRNRLNQGEASWWVKERRGLAPHKRHLMQQEHPSTPEEAFLLSGDRFIKRQVPVPPGDPKTPNEHGIVVLEPFDPTCQYSIGIDPAPGSSEKGDPTAVVILNITRKTIALTQEFREPTREHEARTRRLIAEWGDPMTVVETAAEGLGLCDYLRGAGVPMFHMISYSGLNPELLPRHGWRTDVTTRPILWGEIYQAASGEWPVTIGCHRLVHQLNALCYDKKGKPAAPKTGNDDLAVAFGLALLGSSQALPATHQVVVRKSATQTALEKIDEMLLKAQNGEGDFHADAYEQQPSDFFM